MKAKVKVKSISIISSNTANTANTEDSYSYEYLFAGCDTIYVLDTRFVCGIDAGTISFFDDSQKYKSQKDIFDLINVHSKETLIVETDKNNTVIGVELIYG